MSNVLPMQANKQAMLIHYDEIDAHWGKVAPLIQRGLDTQDELTLDAVYRTLINPYGNMQLWIIPYIFAVVTQIVDRPTGIRKCLLVVGGGSGLSNILAELHRLEDWAKKFHGCKKTIIYGREGWLKLPGYKKIAVILEKDLWA